MFRYGDAIKQVARVFLGELAMIAVMLGIYALLGKLTLAVVLGAIAGGLLAIGNFLALSISVTKATEYAVRTGDHEKATLMVRSSAPARMLVLAGLYIAILATKRFDAFAAVLPLVFVQFSVMLTEYFRKDGGQEK